MDDADEEEEEESLSDFVVITPIFWVYNNGVSWRSDM